MGSEQSRPAVSPHAPQSQPSISNFDILQHIMQERMDAAVTRAVIRAAAVAISGTFGFAVMYKYNVATNPYGLTAILCVWAALIGTQFSNLFTRPLICCACFTCASETQTPPAQTWQAPCSSKRS